MVIVCLCAFLYIVLNVPFFLPFPLFPLYFLLRTHTHPFALNGMVALYLGTPGRRTNCGGTGIKVQDSHHRSEYKEDDEQSSTCDATRNDTVWSFPAPHQPSIRIFLSPSPPHHTTYICYTIVSPHRRVYVVVPHRTLRTNWIEYKRTVEGPDLPCVTVLCL